MNAKILFTDLDGTLLNDQKEITSGNQQAIDEALAKGHKIVISTGRPLASARIQAARLGLDREGCYAITYNGGQIYDFFHRKTLYGRPLPIELITPVFMAAYEAGLHIHTYSSTQVLSERETPELLEYASTTLMQYQIVEHIAEALEEPPYKMIVISLSHDRLLAFQEELLQHYPDELDCFFSSDILLEIVPKGISKGFAVHWMCRYLGIPLENSVAAGDAQNDIPMLEAAQVGAVMRNAFPGDRKSVV